MTIAATSLALLVISCFTFLSLSTYWFNSCGDLYGVDEPKIAPQGPTLINPSLKAELVSQGLKAPTSMIFLGGNDVLVTEKNTGIVQRIVSGKLQPPLVKLNVSTADERDAWNSSI